MAGTERLAVALLAAGRSVRFGEADKRVALLGGKPLLHWAAAAGKGINAAQHFLVTSADFPQQHCPDGYMLLVNPDAQEGLASSLRLVARRARESEAGALLVLLGDMPLVRAAHLAALVATFDATPLRPVFTRAPGGPPQPPALFHAAHFAALEALSGDNGARALARGAAFVEAPADSLVDVDTPADLALCARLTGG